MNSPAQLAKAAAPFREIAVGGCVAVNQERRADGATVLRSSEALQPYPARMSDRLEHFARLAPQRTLIARRDPAVPGGGDWIRLSYAQVVQRAKSIGQALLNRGLSPERPVLILSDNDLEHFCLSMGAMWVGVPFVPVSSAYSLIAQDPAKLQHIVRTVTPGLIFASGPAYAKAIEAALDVAGANVDVVLTEGQIAFGASQRSSTAFSELLATPPGPECYAAHAGVGPDTIVKFLFTSGSTQNPKGVINTHRMWCSNQQMQRQAFAFTRELETQHGQHAQLAPSATAPAALGVHDGPLVLIDWLPWNHTFGGNSNTGFVLYNGGSLYIDDGRPTPKGMATTLRNLREIAPTMYFNVPKGFEEIAATMEQDPALRDNLFSRVQAFFYAGAGLSQAVWDQLDRLGERTIGKRIGVLTGLGMTETAPSCMFALDYRRVRSGHIGLPCPGVEVKLVPEGTGPLDKVEVRFRGPNVMPGYWREPALTAQAFDEEGFYRTGDAARWVDESDPTRGLLFDGRLAEDFKLDTGTFVSVGPLRAKVIAKGAPCIQDVVVAGLNRSEIGALIFPRIDECRKLAQMGDEVPAQAVLNHATVLTFFQQVLNAVAQEATGSANRVARMLLLHEPPAIDKGELTDKGSINQRAVLTYRAALVEDLYAEIPGTGSQALFPVKVR